MIEIGFRDLESIVSHCKEVFPVEACGILAGKMEELSGVIVKKVLKVYHSRNELNSRVEYRINAEEQFRIFNEIEDSGLTLLGFYHSHPNAFPKPSSVDEERANYYECFYLIVALKLIKISSWILEKKGVFKEEEIHITHADQQS